MSVYRLLVDSKTLTAVIITILVQAVVLVAGLLPVEDTSYNSQQDRRGTKLAMLRARSVARQRARLEKTEFKRTGLSRASIGSGDTQDREIDGTRLVKRSYTVVSGDTLTSIWSKNADNPKGGLLAAAALEERKIPLSLIRAGDELTLHLNSSGDIIYFEKALRDGEKLILEGDSGAGYRAKRLTARIIETERVASGIINRSFSTAATRAEVPYEIIDELVDLFASRVEFRRDLQPGDSFSIVYTERHLEDGQRISPGPIQAASLQNNGQMLAAVRHTGADNQARYYDEGGKPLGNYFLRYPLRFTRISSVFNKSRFHPILKSRRAHNGVDFAAPTGTPVRAVADGIVSVAGYKGGAGKMVKISHGSRWATAYLHLSQISSGITNGMRVKRGQVIGKVGMTGYATGPHLHYSLYDNGRYVDPLTVKLPSMPENAKPIPADILQAAVKRLNRQHKKLQYAQLIDAPNKFS